MVAPGDDWRIMTPEYRDMRIQCSLRYLEEVRDLAVRHRATAEYIRSLEEDAAGVGGIDYSRMVVSTSPTRDRLPNSVALLVEMKERAEADAEEYFRRKDEARALLDEMDGTYGRLLMLRYCDAFPWTTVAEAMNYSQDWCKHIVNDALCELYDHLPHQYRLPECSAI